jgi:hypothetical protein
MASLGWKGLTYSSPDILASASLQELVCYLVEINTAIDIL